VINLSFISRTYLEDMNHIQSVVYKHETVSSGSSDRFKHRFHISLDHLMQEEPELGVLPPEPGTCLKEQGPCLKEQGPVLRSWDPALRSRDLS